MFNFKLVSLRSVVLSLIALGSVLVFANLAYADVWVNGYTKSNGTYVSGHYRSSPDSNPYNNWSYPGNTNPYTGVTAGGNSSTYLNNYYSDSRSGFATPSYTIPSYTPSYSTYTLSTYIPSYSSYSGLSSEDIYKEVSNGWESYGVLYCDSGYYSKGSKCVKDPTNGYTIGSTIFCNYGYEKQGSSCIKPTNGTYNYLGAVSCDSGYRNVNDKCVKDTIKLRCQIEFGVNAEPYKDSDEDCVCKTGYQWSTSGDSCVNIPVIQSKVIKSYVKTIGDSTVLSCEDMGWVNPEDVRSCIFYKSNKSKYNWTVN